MEVLGRLGLASGMGALGPTGLLRRCMQLHSPACSCRDVSSIDSCTPALVRYSVGAGIASDGHLAGGLLLQVAVLWIERPEAIQRRPDTESVVWHAVRRN